MKSEAKTELSCLVFFLSMLALFAVCGCSTINYYVTITPDGGPVTLDTTIYQSVPKTLTSSIPLGDSAIAAAKAIAP